MPNWVANNVILRKVFSTFFSRVHATLYAAWSAGRLVVRSGGPSVADYSEQATYGVWPCLKREVWQIVCMGHRTTFRLSFLRIFEHEHKEFTFQISGIIKQLFMRRAGGIFKPQIGSF